MSQHNTLLQKTIFLSDALSHGKMSHFRRLGPNMNSMPDKIRDTIWPEENIWLK